MNPPTLPYRDRKGGLIAFGVFTILFGLCSASFAPLMLLGQSFAPQAGAPSAQMSILPAISIYTLLGVTLIWLGIGSIMGRRWARALILIFSWSWLIMGLASVGMMAYVLPQMGEAVSAGGQMDRGAARAIMIIPIIFMGIFFVLIPGVWIFFYRSPHVKATCEALDPVERWTDRCPLPVLAICIWLAFSVPMMSLMGVAYNGMFPLFGAILTGFAGSAIYLFVAAVWAYCAWSLYRLESRGWWILVVSFVLFSVSAFITYSRHDVGEVYRLMGYSEAMLAEIQKYSFLKNSSMRWMSVAGLPFILGYLLFIRRYLRTSQSLGN